MGVYRKNMLAMLKISENVDKNEATKQKFGHRKKKKTYTPKREKKEERETEKLGSRERKNRYMPNYKKLAKKLEESPNILESHRTI